MSNSGSTAALRCSFSIISARWCTATSASRSLPANRLIDLVARLRASLELTLLGLLLAVVVGLPLSILAATRPNTWIDQLTQLRIYLPTFFTGLVLIYVFYYLLGWSPAPLGRLDLMLLNPPETVTGFYLIDIVFAGDWEVFRSALVQLILPAVTLGFFALAPLVRNSIGSSATPPAITVGWD